MQPCMGGLGGGESLEYRSVGDGMRWARGCVREDVPLAVLPIPSGILQALRPVDRDEMSLVLKRVASLDFSPSCVHALFMSLPDCIELFGLRTWLRLRSCGSRRGNHGGW